MSNEADDPRTMGVHHRGVVMPWECDDMGHMNIRFHVARYGQALRHAAASGAPFAQAGARRVADRFVFLKEARVGARVACPLSVSQATTDVTTVSGCLLDIGSDDVLARFEAVFSMDADYSIADEIVSGEKWTDGLSGKEPISEWISAMGAFAASPDDAFGGAEARTAAVSDANALAVLELSRGGGYRMERSSIGFVVAELAFRYFAPPAGGAAFSVHTALLARSRRSLTFRHRIVAPGGALPIAAVRSVCVFFDRDTRQAVPVPFEL